MLVARCKEVRYEIRRVCEFGNIVYLGRIRLSDKSWLETSSITLEEAVRKARSYIAAKFKARVNPHFALNFMHS